MFGGANPTNPTNPINPINPINCQRQKIRSQN